MARIGIFGGTFNPVHAGHKNLADNIKREKQLDAVYIIPTNLPPHKQQAMAENEHRLAMCKLVFKPEEGYKVSDLEFRLGGKSYTINTLEYLKKQHPNDELFLIIGSDMLYTFELWKDYKRILDIACVLVGARSADEFKLMEKKAELIGKQGGNVEVVPIDVISVSSTGIRESTEKSAMYLDEKVAEYIKQNNLYSPKPLALSIVRDIVKQNLNSERYFHSVCVAREAVKLAKQYGADLYKAELAGLLHDVMKNKDTNYLLHYFYCNGIILTNVENECHELWHAIAGAAFIQHELGINDRDVISAIRYHTTARKDMSLLEKIIFIADCNSEDRAHNGVEESRILTKENIDDAIIFNLKHTMNKLISSGRPLHPDSVQAYNYLLQKNRRT